MFLNVILFKDTNILFLNYLKFKSIIMGFVEVDFRNHSHNSTVKQNSKHYS